MGLRMPRTERHVLRPPESVVVTGDIPNATNTTVWKFDPVPDGTLLTAVLDIRFKGMLRLLQPVAQRQGTAGLRGWMRAFARHVEAKCPNHSGRAGASP
jgi:hypothetical protein